MTYASRGNNTSTTTYRTLPNGSTETATTTMVYDADNRVVKTIAPDLTESFTSYNAIGKVASTTDELGRVTTHTYNSRGEQISTLFPDGTTQSTVYDDEGRAISSTDRGNGVRLQLADKPNRKEPKQPGLPLISAGSIAT